MSNKSNPKKDRSFISGPRVPRSSEDLKRAYDEQLDLLWNNTRAYDRGSDAVAVHIASVLRVLIHDTGRSSSLLSQLGLKSMQFVSTARPPLATGENSFSDGHWGLIWINIEASAIRYVPVLDLSTCHTMGFDDWWLEPVFARNGSYTVTRKHLVLAIADTDGGAHIDPNLDEWYADLSRGNPFNNQFYLHPGDKPPLHLHESNMLKKPIHPERAAIRQIAHELFKTLWPGFIEPITYGGFMFGEMSVNIQRIDTTQ